MKVYESVSKLINNVNGLINSKFDDVVSEFVKDVDDYKIVFYDFDDIYVVFKVYMRLFVRKVVIDNDDDDVYLIIDNENYDYVLMDLIFG